jgi:hypothetical protein
MSTKHWPEGQVRAAQRTKTSAPIPALEPTAVFAARLAALRSANVTEADVTAETVLWSLENDPGRRFKSWKDRNRVARESLRRDPVTQYADSLDEQFNRLFSA